MHKITFALALTACSPPPTLPDVPDAQPTPTVDAAIDAAPPPVDAEPPPPDGPPVTPGESFCEINIRVDPGLLAARVLGRFVCESGRRALVSLIVSTPGPIGTFGGLFTTVQCEGTISQTFLFPEGNVLRLEDIHSEVTMIDPEGNAFKCEVVP